MKNRLWMTLVIFSVTLAAYLGYRLNLSAASVPSTPSVPSLTEEITGWLQYGNMGHAIQDVHVINYEQVHGKRFAFVSYKMDGRPLFSSISADQQGRAIESLSPPRPNTMVPWDYIDMELSRDGFHLVTGIVYDHSIKNLIFTFTNGYVATVPVVGGYVFYVNPVALPSGCYPKNAIGVAASGEIVEYHVQ